jgi:hypothetical protein
MPRDGFPTGVAEQLKWYVYRLIDPRNGETFYVGKGQRNRIFEHAKGILASEEENIADPKLQRIKEINAAGLEVGHVIHRHGIDAPRTAYEVEAALIDAYPGLSNKVRGHGSKDYGSRHVEEIIDEYAGEEFVVNEPLILISIGTMYYQRNDAYEAVRYAWKINDVRARTYNLVLANLRGLVVGAYRPTDWLKATRENFPGLESNDRPSRWGFVGEPAESEVWNHYVRKRVPQRYRRRGAQAPVRYCDP